MEQLLTQAETALNELESLRNSNAPDAQIKAKTAEFDALQTRIEDAKAQARRRKALDEARRDLALAADPAGKTLRVPAQPRDAAREAAAKTGLFLDYVCGKSLSDRAMDALAPANSKARAKYPDAVAVPAAVTAAFMGRQYSRVFGKSLLSIGDAGAPAESTDSGVSHLIAPDFRAEVVSAPIPVSSVVDYVRIIPAVNGEAEFPKFAQADGDEFAGAAVTWSAEGEAKDETKPQFTNLKIATNELSAMTYPSLRMLRRSAINLEAFLVDLLGQAVRNALAEMVFRGSGDGQGSGLIGFAGVNKVARRASGTVSVADFDALEYGVRKQFRQGARFWMHDDAERVCKGLVDAEGRPVLRRFFNDAVESRINGYPYEASYQPAALGSEGDVVFGNMAWYFLAVEQEMSLTRSDHFKFDQALAALRLIGYFGGKPAHPRAFAVLDDLTATTTAATTTAG